jgi:hypothetical protein
MSQSALFPAASAALSSTVLTGPSTRIGPRRQDLNAQGFEHEPEHEDEHEQKDNPFQLQITMSWSGESSPASTGNTASVIQQLANSPAPCFDRTKT